MNTSNIQILVAAEGSCHVGYRNETASQTVFQTHSIIIFALH